MISLFKVNLDLIKRVITNLVKGYDDDKTFYSSYGEAIRLKKEMNFVEVIKTLRKCHDESKVKMINKLYSFLKLAYVPIDLFDNR
jgi:hypothetical protein